MDIFTYTSLSTPQTRPLVSLTRERLGSHRLLASTCQLHWSRYTYMFMYALRHVQRDAQWRERNTVWFADTGKTGKPPPTCVDVPVTLEQVYIYCNVYMHI